jgi:hypothetical protein
VLALRAIQRRWHLGGRHGWYAADWLWRLRGVLDRLAGGPGLRRGRRHAERVSFGEALDFWRVVAVDPDRRLELRAEMRLPGDASLQFRIEPERGSTRLCQTARFRPRGLLGIAYWYALLPLHGIVFRGEPATWLSCYLFATSHQSRQSNGSPNRDCILLPIARARV